MRTDWTHLDQYREEQGQYGTQPGETFGAFVIRLSPFTVLFVIACDAVEPVNGEHWEHVSVTAYTKKIKPGTQRTPTWGEMAAVKAMFWTDDEAVMQLHPPRSQYVNNCEHCLHLWKPMDWPLKTPPMQMV